MILLFNSIRDRFPLHQMSREHVYRRRESYSIYTPFEHVWNYTIGSCTIMFHNTVPFDMLLSNTWPCRKHRLHRRLCVPLVQVAPCQKTKWLTHGMTYSTLLDVHDSPSLKTFLKYSIIYKKKSRDIQNHNKTHQNISNMVPLVKYDTMVIHLILLNHPVKVRDSSADGKDVQKETV